MTPQQLKFYRWAASQARTGMERIRGKLTASEWDRERRRIHAQAGAEGASSITLTNEQFDRVLAIFFSWSHAASLDLQLEQLEQPARRCRFVAESLLDQINTILEASGREKQAVYRGPGRDAYLLHIARRVAGDESLTIDSLTEAHWIEIVIRLRYRFHQVTGRSTGGGRQAKRRRPLDNDHIPRPQDRRKPVQAVLTLDEEDPF